MNTVILAGGTEVGKKYLLGRVVKRQVVLSAYASVAAHEKDDDDVSELRGLEKKLHELFESENYVEAAKLQPQINQLRTEIQSRVLDDGDAQKVDEPKIDLQRCESWLETKHYNARLEFLVARISPSKTYMDIFNDNFPSFTCQALILIVDLSKESPLDDVNHWAPFAESECPEVMLLVGNHRQKSIENIDSVLDICQNWSLDNGFEFIEMYHESSSQDHPQTDANKRSFFQEKIGADRVLEALECNMWSEMERVEINRSLPPDLMEQKLLGDDANDAAIDIHPNSGVNEMIEPELEQLSYNSLGPEPELHNSRQVPGFCARGAYDSSDDEDIDDQDLERFEKIYEKIAKLEKITKLEKGPGLSHEEKHKFLRGASLEIENLWADDGDGPC